MVRVYISALLIYKYCGLGFGCSGVFIAKSILKMMRTLTYPNLLVRSNVMFVVIAKDQCTH